MLWLPTANPDVLKLATPLALSAGLPSVLPPSRNVTVPVGVPAPGAALTVAVKLTACPKTDGLTDEASTVVEYWPGLLTTCVKMGETLVVKLPSPPYCALIECVPAAS